MWCFLGLHQTSVRGSRSARRFPSPLADFSTGFTKPGPAKGSSRPPAAVRPSALPTARPMRLQRLRGAGGPAVRSLGASCPPQPLGQTNPLAVDLGVQVHFRLLSFPPLCTQLSPFGSCALVAAVVCAVFSPPPAPSPLPPGWVCPWLVLVLQRHWRSRIQLFTSFYLVIRFWVFCHPGQLLFLLTPSVGAGLSPSLSPGWNRCGPAAACPDGAQPAALAVGLPHASPTVFSQKRGTTGETGRVTLVFVVLWFVSPLLPQPPYPFPVLPFLWESPGVGSEVDPTCPPHRCAPPPLCSPHPSAPISTCRARATPVALAVGLFLFLLASLNLIIFSPNHHVGEGHTTNTSGAHLVPTGGSRGCSQPRGLTTCVTPKQTPGCTVQQ